MSRERVTLAVYERAAYAGVPFERVQRLREGGSRAALVYLRP